MRAFVLNQLVVNNLLHMPFRTFKRGMRSSTSPAELKRFISFFTISNGGSVLFFIAANVQIFMWFAAVGGAR